MADEKITFADGVPGYAFGEKGRPGVVMLQEWWGVNEQVKRHARKLAAAGCFRVIVPDIYKGKVGVDKEEAAHLMNALDWATAVQEICGAASHLKAEGSVKVGATGFCMGGALSLLGAVNCSDISCAAPFYGVPRDERVDLSHLSKPVQGHFGKLDQSKGFSDEATAIALRHKLKDFPDSEIYVYDSVGHGFLNDTPEPFASFEERKAALGHVYDAATCELAWTRLIAFLNKHLAE
jgi:carboxymethylenebutenolidase